MIFQDPNMSLPGRLSFGVCSTYFCVLTLSFCVLLPISVPCLFFFGVLEPISVSCLVSGAAAVGSALPRFNPPAGGLRL